MHLVVALNVFFVLVSVSIYYGADEALVLSMGDVMRAICFSPVKGTCVCGRVLVCVLKCECVS